MNPERWEQIKAVFNAALERPPSERSAFLDSTCTGDPELHAEVERLLAEHERANSFLDQPLIDPDRGSTDYRPIFTVNDLVSGRYRILRFVDKGGMGEVYEATDLDLNVRVALKTLLSSVAADQSRLARFKREIHLAREVQEEHICRIHDFGRHHGPNGTEIPYLTMQFLEGETLASRIRRAGPFSTVEALLLILQMTQALAAAHKLGIIHRDFKPTNVMLVPMGRDTLVKVTDFGLARTVARTERLDRSLTPAGHAVGTPAYMAPEQFRGEATIASDIYALGVVMHEMLTGVRPGGSDSSPSRTLDPRWKAVIAKCIEADPAKRFQSVEEIIPALTAEDDLPTVTIEGQARARSRRWVYIALAAFLLVGCGVLLWEYEGKVGRPVPDPKHIAVMPFANITGRNDDEAFSEGIVETLTNKLSQLERFHTSLWIIPSSEVRRTKGSIDALRRIGATLLITGSIQRIGDHIRLVTNLEDPIKTKLITSRTIDTKLSQLFVLQDRVWEEVSRMLQVQLRPEVRTSLAAGETIVPEAYEFYEQGNGYLRRNGLDNVQSAISSFQRALEKDERYGLAFAKLGEAFSRKYYFTKDPASLELAKTNCYRALALNDGIAPAHSTLGQIYLASGDYLKAEEEFRRVLRIDPMQADAYGWLGRAYDAAGRIQEAEDNLKRSLNMRPSYWVDYNVLGWFYFRHARYAEAESMFRSVTELLPDDVLGYNNLGGLYLTIGRNAEAEKVLRHSLAIKPDSQALSNLATAYVYQGRYREAATAMEKAVQLVPADARLWGNLGDAYQKIPGMQTKAEEAYQKAISLADQQIAVNPADGVLLSARALYWAKLGQPAKALADLEKSLRLNPSDLQILFNAALINEITGDRKGALAYLKTAVHNGYSKGQIEHDPDLVRLRTDSRFKQIMALGQATVR